MDIVKYMIQKYRYYWAVLLVFVSVISISAITDSASQNAVIFRPELIPNIETKAIYREFCPVHDTLFVLGDAFITVSIDDQVTTLYTRDNEPLRFPVSTGSKHVNRGEETPPGIYNVYSMAKVAFSRQFNNAKLLNWIAFYRGFGFHGLPSDNYYRTLGVRPASHGCVRISREDGDVLFEQTEMGTPIMVFEGKPARILAFGEPADFNPSKDIKLNGNFHEHRDILQKRLEMLYSGRFLVADFGKIYITKNSNLEYQGLSTGDALRIPFRQELPDIDHSLDMNIKRDKLVYQTKVKLNVSTEIISEKVKNQF